MFVFISMQNITKVCSYHLKQNFSKYDKILIAFFVFVILNNTTQCKRQWWDTLEKFGYRKFNLLSCHLFKVSQNIYSITVKCFFTIQVLPYQNICHIPPKKIFDGFLQSIVIPYILLCCFGTVHFEDKVVIKNYSARKKLSIDI